MPPSTPCAGTGKIGCGATRPALAMTRRSPSAVAAAIPTSTIERGRSSNASSSTPNNVAATGVPKTALIPAAAPATSRLRRWAAVSRKSWPTTEPTAPPVRMIGPSAPNGPPVPMLIALEIGLRTASRGWTRLPLIRIRSIASGMPWPRICSEPNRAIRPTTRPPPIGMTTASAPSVLASGETRSTLSRW